MAIVRKAVPFLAIVALASMMATPRTSNAQIMDPDTPPRHGMVAVAPGLESGLPAPSSRLDDFLTVRSTQLRIAAMRWLSNASGAPRTHVVRVQPRTRGLR